MLPLLRRACRVLVSGMVLVACSYHDECKLPAQYMKKCTDMGGCCVGYSCKPGLACYGSMEIDVGVFHDKVVVAWRGARSSDKWKATKRENDLIVIRCPPDAVKPSAVMSVYESVKTFWNGYGHVVFNRQKSVAMRHPHAHCKAEYANFLNKDKPSDRLPNTGQGTRLAIAVDTFRFQNWPSHACVLPKKYEQKCHAEHGCCIADECKDAAGCPIPQEYTHHKVQFALTDRSLCDMPRSDIISCVIYARGCCVGQYCYTQEATCAKLRESHGTTVTLPRSEDPSINGELASAREGRYIVDHRTTTLAALESGDASNILMFVDTFLKSVRTSAPTIAPTASLHRDKKTCELNREDYATCVSIGGCCRWDRCFQGEACKVGAVIPTHNPTQTPTGPPTVPTPVPSKPPTQQPSSPTQAPTTPAPTNSPTTFPTGQPTKPTKAPTPHPTHPTRAPTPKATMKAHKVGWAGLLHIKQKMEAMDPEHGSQSTQSLGGDTVNSDCRLPPKWLANCRNANKCCAGMSCQPCPKH
jgi:hypothetical protein